jgi:kinesin family protein 2/24
MNAGYAMGGQMEQQNNVAIQHQQLLHHSSNHAAVSSDSPNGDAVLARWLQSAGLQHLAAPLAAAALDHRLLPSLLMQDYARYGVQSLEDKQKLFRLIKTISSGVEPPPPAEEPTTPPACSHSASQSGMDDVFFSPEFKADFGPEILDLHSIDDTEFFPETSIPEPFQPSPLFEAVTEKEFESEDEGHLVNIKQQNKSQVVSVSSPPRSSHNEKDRNGNSVARIKVVVRKRPINKKELARKEEDIITINDAEASLTVHEPKVKVPTLSFWIQVSISRLLCKYGIGGHFTSLLSV